MPPPALSEVKGVWFVTARRYVTERAGDDALQQMANRIDRNYRHVLLEPFPSEWYPERVLQQALAAMHVVVAGGKDERFIEAMEDCTTLGIHRFFRTIMRFSSPTVVLRKVPAMWNHIRRGAGTVTVEADLKEALLHYTRFPYFRDPNYRLLTIGAVRSLVHVCGSAVAEIEVVDFSFDEVRVRVAWR